MATAAPAQPATPLFGAPPPAAVPTGTDLMGPPLARPPAPAALPFALAPTPLAVPAARPPPAPLAAPAPPAAAADTRPWQCRLGPELDVDGELNDDQGRNAGTLKASGRFSRCEVRLDGEPLIWF